MIISSCPADPKERKLDVGETYVACDGCKRRCEGSEVSGTRGQAIWNKASELAKALGWKEKLVPRSNRSKKATWTVKTLCPECFAKDESK